ncbi:MAG: hypothetical protein AAF640_01140 [Pseudomonadota bacterium]
MPAWSNRGIAMVTVLWFVAAMALLVGGIVGSARTDVRMAQFHLQEAEGTAAADGAIRLFLADYVDGVFLGEVPELARARYRVGEIDVMVVAIPVSQLVDPNSAPPELLRSSLEAAGAGSTSSELAQAIVTWRERPRDQRRGRGRTEFAVTEALLEVPGLGRRVWDRLRDYVAVGTGVGGGLYGGAGNSRAAGQGVAVLRTLAPSARAARGSLDPGPVSVGSNWRTGGGLRIDAMFENGGRRWLRRRWERVGASGSSGLPWTTERVEGTRIVNGSAEARG